MVYVFLADGFETIEALAVVDMLRRAKIDNETVGVTGKTVKSSHNIEVVADITIDELNISNADAIVLPGGMPGTLNLEANGIVQSSIDYCVENKKYVCAICAAPSILGHKGLLKGRYVFRVLRKIYAAQLFLKNMLFQMAISLPHVVQALPLISVLKLSRRSAAVNFQIKSGKLSNVNKK